MVLILTDVFTEQAVDSPGNDVEVDVVVGREGPESLRDAAQAQPIFEGCIVTGWGDGGVGGHGADPSTSGP